LDLLKSEFGVTRYREIPVYPLSAEEGKVRLGLELQADRAAGFTGLQFWRMVYSNSPKLAEFGISPDKMWLFAMCSIMVVFEYMDAIFGRPPETTHPSAFRALSEHPDSI
jgi:hypothetical protein